MKCVSIIVPVYNVKPYLERCVQSICNQTYSNLEIILVNDGSTDGSGELCNELALQDQRIKVYHKKNGGASSARNLGLREASGDYIGFVDGDDYITNKMYEQLVEGLETNPCNIVQIGRAEVEEDGTTLPDIVFRPEQDCVITSEDMIQSLLMHKGDSSFCTKLFTKEVFAIKNFLEGMANEDFRLLIEILMEEKEMVQLSQVGYFVCYRKGSITRVEGVTKFSRVYYDCIQNADWMIEVLEGQKELQKMAIRFGLYQRSIYLLHIPIPMMTSKNKEYLNVIRYIRSHLSTIVTSAYLTPKDKVYLLLFATNAKWIRQVHKWLKRAV